MRIHKIIYLMWTMIIFSSPVELSSERISEETKSKRLQMREEDEKPMRLKKQQPLEKVTVPEDDDEKKTLAQQVLDGKYGLIQTELFSSPVKRPGILSYEVNPEVPKDNINNLGGLKPEEIWLAENHLLVLKGGGFSEKEQTGKVIWPPIDNYIAPQRQVKIPPNPKVPPPFPIQLKEGGPIEVIQGKNNTKSPPYFNGPFGPPFLFPLGPNILAGRNEDETKQGQGNSTQGNGGGVPFPYLPPGIGLYPPAIAFLPPPGNLTELDEDDPTIYYPPKYDFVYKKNYTSHVPPGPLVPGIILPPPPNFFAPLDNDTKSLRPNENNKPSVSPKKPSKTRLSPGNASRHKALPVNSYKPKGTHHSREQKLISPIRVISNNEHVYKPQLNTSKEEWVPIPAPRPFYITEINKLRALVNSKLNDHTLKYDGPRNGWDYDNSTGVETSKKVEDEYTMNRYLNAGNPDIKKETYYSTEINENNLISTTPPPKLVSNYETNNPSIRLEDKRKYLINNQNSQIIRGKFLNPVPQEPPPRYVEHFVYNKPYVEINTLIPKRVYGDVTIKTPSLSGRIKLPNIKYEEDYKNTVKPTSKPLSYLYYDQESKYQADDGGYSYDVPVSSIESSYRPEQYRVFPVSVNTRQQITSYSSTTTKPPVYEYSYSAPGYGTVEAPKVGNNIITTAKPPVYETNFKEPQFTYFDYQSSSKQNNYKSKNVAPQQSYSTTQRPIQTKTKYAKVDPYQTENPYLSYNTQDLGLLDDITKKYFTLFGQKLNQEDAKEITTTSAPQTNQNYYDKQYYKNYDEVAPVPTNPPSTNVRFPENYDIQSDRPYFQNTQEYRAPVYKVSNKKAKPSLEQSDDYSYHYSSGASGLRGYNQYEQDIVRPNHPLDSDVLVNYKVPRPPINPDAELINPAYVNPVSLNGNSYVSYRLPGNSGHFYFLTPQTIRQQNYPQSPRLRYQEIDQRGYIQRDVRHKVLK